jgi:hypothetical protein
MNESRPASGHGMPPKIAAIPVQQVKKDDHSLDSMALVDEPAQAQGTSKIRAFSVPGSHAEKNYKRKTAQNGQGACRVRTFHGRMSDEGLAYMDDKINQWLDDHPEIEVKVVTSSIGMYEGKIKEPALILNVWY